jgi:hypothetical protein
VIRKKLNIHDQLVLLPNKFSEVPLNGATTPTLLKKNVIYKENSMGWWPFRELFFSKHLT